MQETQKLDWIEKGLSLKNKRTADWWWPKYDVIMKMDKWLFNILSIVRLKTYGVLWAQDLWSKTNILIILLEEKS
jgi:hypothetical protein